MSTKEIKRLLYAVTAHHTANWFEKLSHQVFIVIVIENVNLLFPDTHTFRHQKRRLKENNSEFGNTWTTNRLRKLLSMFHI